MDNPVPRSTQPVRELALGGGFLAVALAVVAARASPATGFERSIYAATPTLTWALVLATLLVATWVIVRPDSRDRIVVAAAVLGGTAMTAVVALPLIRGYHYLGSADALTHLGWTKDIAAGVIDPHALFYPGLHSVGVAIARATGTSVESALLVATLVFFVAFLTFVPLTVWFVTGRARALGFAAIATWLVLPINNVGTHLFPHTNSVTLLYVAALLCFLVLYLRSEPGGVLGVTPTGVLLGLSSVALAYLHVQHAINVLLVFLSISAVQFASGRWLSSERVDGHRTVYAQTTLLAVLVAAWFLAHETVARGFFVTFRNLLYDGALGAATVAQRGTSLAAIGAGLGELFVKLFLVSALVLLVTLGYLVATGRGYLRVPDTERSLLVYFALALVPLGGVFAVYYAGTPTMSFRVVGFVYVLVTILGAMAFLRFTDWAGRSLPGGYASVGVVLSACLVLSLLTVFASPYIYTPTPVVSEQETQGFAATLETRTGDVPLATLSTLPYRHGDAHFGTTRSDELDYVGPGDGLFDPEGFNAGNVSAAYPADTYYAVITESDVVAETEVYDELNYRRSRLAAFDTDRRSNRVVANGEVEAYLVSAD